MNETGIFFFFWQRPAYSPNLIKREMNGYKYISVFRKKFRYYLPVSERGSLADLGGRTVEQIEEEKMNTNRLMRFIDRCT